MYNYESIGRATVAVAKVFAAAVAVMGFLALPELICCLFGV